MNEDGTTTLANPPARSTLPASTGRESHPARPPAARTAEDAAALDAILEELRMLRREQRHEDFSIARLAAAIAQAFALCAIGWGLFAWIDATPEQTAAAATSATIRLLAGIGFQLMALTFFVASRKN